MNPSYFKQYRTASSCLKARQEADVLARELDSCRRQLELVSSAGARLAADKGQRVRRHLMKSAQYVFFIWLTLRLSSNDVQASFR